MISWAGQWTRIPSATPLQTKKWYAHFCITFNFWWLARLVNGLEPHPPALSSQRMKCSFLDYIQLLMIGWAGRWTRTSSTTPFQAKKWNAYFCIMFNFWWSAGLVDGLKHHLLPLSSQKNEMLIFVLCSTSGDQPGWLMDSNPICHPSQAKKKNEMLIFGLHLTSDDQPGWSMDSNPIHHPSLTKKMKCSFLDYIQLLVISRAGWWSQTPSATPLQPKKWYAHFWITFNFLWLARLVNGLEPHLQPLFNQKMKCLFLYYVIVQIISRAGRWTQSPSTTPQAKKMKC